MKRSTHSNPDIETLALRSYDPKTSQWSIWWLDGRSPHGDLDPPVQGRFENGVGTFHGNTTIDGRATRIRFVWSQTTAASPRWEQAYSYDGGKTWETNWLMEVQREPVARRSAAHALPTP